MKTFVTGAAGFIGREVVAELARMGDNVVAQVRTKQDAEIVIKAGGRPIECDLIAAGAWCEEIASADSVISVTTPFEGEQGMPTMSKVEEYGRRYTESVTNLIKAASGGNARNVVMVYSTQCMGDRHGQWVADADALNPVGYCRPLVNSFKAIARTAEDAELPLVEIYPAFVYGNGGWFAKTVDSFRKGTAKVVAPGDNFLSLIHVEDAAKYIALASRKLTKDESICIADDRPVTQRVLMDHIADLLDRPVAPTVSFEAYAREFGQLAAEAMSCSTRVQGLKAMDLLGHIPDLRSYEAGIRYTLEEMGIEPRCGVISKAA